MQEYLPILMFVVLLASLLLGYPFAFVLMGVATVFGLAGWGPDIFAIFTLRAMGVMKNYILLAVPLFIFMGLMMERSGVAERLFSAMHLWLGGLKGGLAVVTVLVCTLFAAGTGVIAASVTTMGIFALPAMLKRDYDKSLATGTVCAGGTLGILIPPSVMIVLYAPAAGLSVGKMFMGAFMPGIMLSVLYTIYILVRCRIQPELGPPAPVEERRAVSLPRKFGLLLTSILPPITIILTVLGTIFAGVAAPTEAAAMGALAAMLLAAGYRQLNLQTLKWALFQTMRITGMAMLIVIGACMFNSVFSGIGGSAMIKDLVLAVPGGVWGALAIMMVVLIILGMFMDWIGIVMIIVPLITPIAAALGFDPIWFAVLVCVNLQISFLSPPFAYAIFFLKAVAPEEVTLGHIYRGVIPFVVIQIIGVVICILFPKLILWLPSMMIK